MAVSMRDIATAAGVSVSTVSRALAGSPRVKPGTQAEIQRLAHDLGYVPSAIARGLATRRTYSLGVAVMDITDPFVAELVRAIDRAALDQGYSLILSHCGADPQRELAAIHLLRQRRADAIIVCDSLVSDSRLPLLEPAGVPIILVNRPSYRYSACTDNVQGARQAVDHLLALGHTRIAYVGWRHREEENRERQVAYEQALAAHGLDADPSLVVDGDGWPEGGRRGMRQLLTLSPMPTALFCFNDLTAIGAMAAAQDAGWRVPDDLSVVGFDDIHLAPHTHPPLTTLSQQKEELARLAVSLALSLIAGEEPPPAASLPAQLVVRSSTAHPRVDSDRRGGD